MKRWSLIIAVFLLSYLPIQAQSVLLMATKSGNDVILSWSGGTGPYTVVSARHPSMTIRTRILASTSGTTYTDTGAASVTPRLVFYVVSDSTAPTVTITNILPNFSSSHLSLCVSGTSSSVNTVQAVYCNSLLATGTSIWTTCNPGYRVPLAVPFDPLVNSGSTFQSGQRQWTYGEIGVLPIYSGSLQAP
jgi:hypothetical protein